MHIGLNNDIGNRVKKRREELGMTQLELAKKLGYGSKSTVCKVESGVHDMTQSNVVKYAEALQTTPAYLMGWEQEVTQDMDYLLHLHGDDFVIAYMKAPVELQKRISEYGKYLMEKWENENRETPKR